MAERDRDERVGFASLAGIWRGKVTIADDFDELPDDFANGEVTVGDDASVDPQDVRLAETMLDLTPLERLRLLRRFTRLHSLTREAPD